MMAYLRTLGGVIINTTERGGAFDVNARVIGRVLEVLEDESCLVRRLGDDVRVRINLAAASCINTIIKKNLLYAFSWYGTTVDIFNIILKSNLLFKCMCLKPNDTRL